MAETLPFPSLAGPESQFTVLYRGTEALRYQKTRSLRGLGSNLRLGGMGEAMPFPSLAGPESQFTVLYRGAKALRYQESRFLRGLGRICSLVAWLKPCPP